MSPNSSILAICDGHTDLSALIIHAAIDSAAMPTNLQNAT